MSSKENGFKETEIGRIPKDWEITSIGGVCLIRRGASPRPIQNFLSSSGIPWVKISDATSQKTMYIDFTNEYIIEKGRSNTVIVKSGDLILSNSATPGIPKIMRIEAGIHDGWLLISPLEKVNKYFMYYLFLQERNKLARIADGTVFRNLKTDIVRDHLVVIPPLPEQKAIAKVLSDLDDKIELNNEMNKTLEEISQALFKRWFIDFEFPDENGNPYRSSGGEMVYSEKLGKEIPKGWEVKRLDDMAKLEMGISPKGSSYNSIGQGLPLLNGAADFNGKSIKPNKYTTSPTKTCKENDIIFCIRGTIGNITFSDSIYCIGRGVSSLSPYKDDYRELIFLSLNQYLNKLINNAFGSVILGLSKEDISSLLILLPSGDTIKLFHNIVLNLNYLLKNNNIQSQELSELRDSLLPKLMSGEIRVPLEASQ